VWAGPRNDVLEGDPDHPKHAQNQYTHGCSQGAANPRGGEHTPPSKVTLLVGDLNFIGGSRIFRRGVFGNPSERSKRALRGSGLTEE